MARTEAAEQNREPPRRGGGLGKEGCTASAEAHSTNTPTFVGYLQPRVRLGSPVVLAVLQRVPQLLQEGAVLDLASAVDVLGMGVVGEVRSVVGCGFRV